MRRKRKYCIYILSVFAVFIFAFFCWSVVCFLGISHTKQNKEQGMRSILEKTEKNTSLQMSGTTSSALSQRYRNKTTNGIFTADSKYLYKSEKINEQYALTRINIKNGERFPLVTGYKCRNLIAGEKDIYCIIDTTDKDENFCNKIAKVSRQGDGIKLFDVTVSPYILSMVADQDSIYYTKKGDRKIYKINYDGDIYSYIYEVPASAEEPFLFSVLDGNLYYTDGREMAYIDLTSHTNQNISYQICSRYQNPFLEDGKIFGFSDLSQSSIAYIDLQNGELKKIPLRRFGDSFTPKKIDNIAYYKNNIFLSTESNIYYCNLSEGHGGIVKDVRTPSGIIYFNNDSIIYEDGEYGINSSEEIKWLLAK